MKETGILMVAEMVRQTIAGNKTQTRRIMKPQPGPDETPECGFYFPTRIDRNGDCFPGRKRFGAWVSGDRDWPCPYGAPGDRLWVRETWADTSSESRRHPISYRADWSIDDDANRGFNWRPSIFMPRWASRITLEIVSVRVERVQDISEEDARAEGIERQINNERYWRNYEFKHHTAGHTMLAFSDPRQSFASLWNSINAKRGFGWDSNPWVWVLEFRRVKP